VIASGGSAGWSGGSKRASGRGVIAGTTSALRAIKRSRKSLILSPFQYSGDDARD
jgi:hypothetical protein